MRVFFAVAALIVAVSVGSASAAGVEPIEGAYKGTTSQGTSVYFGVSGGTVINPRFTVVWGECGRNTAHYKTASDELDESGHFSIDTGQTVLEGDFVDPDRVEGTAIFRHHRLAGCPRRAVHYTARLR
ncbi:MAG TPA: hypothetical protein VHM66_08075 [Solirubrobacterales bacterium]|nr:hypothetical protein [Solirubrobacterales bacterium]